MQATTSGSSSSVNASTTPATTNSPDSKEAKRVLITTTATSTTQQTQTPNDTKSIVAEVVKFLVDEAVESAVNEFKSIRDADDSSDEEDGVGDEAFEEKAIHAKYTQFKQSNTNSSWLTEEVFLAHYVGNALLFSRPVRQAYYKKKRLYLSDVAQIPNESTIENHIQTVLSKILQPVFKLSRYVYGREEVIEEQLTQELVKKFINTSGIRLVDALKNRKRLLFRQQNRKKEALSGLENLLTSFAKNALLPFINGLQDMAQEYKFAPAASSFSADTLACTSGAEKEYPNLDVKDYEEKAKKYLRECELFTPKGRFKKKCNITAYEQKINKNDSDYYVKKAALESAKRYHQKDFNCAYLISAYRAIRCHERIKENPSILADNQLHSDELSFSYNINTDPQTKPKWFETKFGQWLLKNCHQCTPYYPLSVQEKIMSQYKQFDFTSSFLDSLQCNLKGSFQRKTLGQNFIFESKDAIDFLANLCLSNRSQRRMIRQLQDEAKFQPQRETEEKGSFFIRECHRSWQFTNGLAALETQRISDGFARDDWVNNLGSYADIYRYLKDLTNKMSLITQTGNQKITDADIAYWIRDILRGDNFTVVNECKVDSAFRKYLLPFLTHFTYLLFGTEAARNPASLIIHPMILDLVIAGEPWTWERIFQENDEAKKMKAERQKKKNNGKTPKKSKEEKRAETANWLIPMSIADAVANARQLQDEFARLQIRYYRYDGKGKRSSTELETLAGKEHGVVTAWRKKFPNEKMKAAIKRWYGIDLSSSQQSSNTASASSLSSDSSSSVTSAATLPTPT